MAIKLSVLSHGPRPCLAVSPLILRLPSRRRTHATLSGHSKAGLGPLMNKKYKVRLTAPLDALQPSFTLQSANQCDIVPEVPDFSWPLISYSVSGSHDGFPVYELYATFR